MAMDMNGLPEDCVSFAISLTTPRDACRLSLVSSTFRSASQSDAVWERFLPSDYLDFIRRSTANLDDIIRSFLSKKQLFLFLADNQLLIDDGNKSFWLDKKSGKKCYMLAARDINIAWGDTPRYWQWISLSESRFPEVAELRFVFWFDICRYIRTDMLSPNTCYVAYLVYVTKADFRGFPDDQPAKGKFGIRGEEIKEVSVCLNPSAALAARARKYQTQPKMRFWRSHSQAGEHQQQTANSGVKVQYPVQRRDHWMEVELGEFFVQGKDVVELEISLLEVKSGHPKSGLIVQGIEIRPERVK